MASQIIKSDNARQRLETWYQHFLGKIDDESQSIMVSTSFGENHVLQMGDSSKPTLLALHAMLTSSAHIASELGPFLDHYHIIAPDIPGQSVRGLPVRLSYTDDSHASWLREITDVLNINNPHILGVSLGGFIALQYASRHPEKIETLSLLVPAGIVQGSLVKGITQMALPAIMYKLFPNEKRLHAMLNPILTTHDEDWANYLGDALNDFSPNTKIPPVAPDEQLEQLKIPSLVMGADEDISFPGDKMVERAANHIHNTETELIDNCKHCPPTTPDFRQWLFNRVNGFINRQTVKH
ncbi:MAG: alpha/beta fold hydrolase [Bacteroidetes bacterium]|jgi:pimeloyl-ACP methyl ester carboxylesterase|nr:alpha/beta fold hydrolase [Bacteroidota bacterium]